MRIGRRDFLRALGSVLAFVSGRGAASPSDTAPKIHTETRNTGFGPVGWRRPGGARGQPRKIYPNAPQLALPGTKAEGAALSEVVRSYAPLRGFEPKSLSIHELSTLLHLTNGVTGRFGDDPKSLRLRASPSAGALYAGEVYIVVEQVDGVAAGLYYYDVAPHHLLRLRSGSLLAEVQRAMERPAEIEGAAVVVLLSNVFGRYTRQYANRGYRYALIDSGHQSENLRLVARAIGLGDASASRFYDDRLNALLEIDGAREAVCALHAVGPAGTKETDGSAETRRFAERQHSGRSVIGRTVIERFHDATKLVLDDRKSPATATDRVAPTRAVDGPTIPLPMSESSATTVASAILARRSAEVFEPTPLALQDVAEVMKIARGNPALERAKGVSLFMIAHRVVDLAPGVYRYANRSHRLIPIRRAELADSLIDVCVGQSMAGAAAAGFVMAAELDAAPTVLGDRSYRDLLLESGAIAQRIYLAAETRGLVARNLAAFVDDRFNELLGLQPLGLLGLHLTMLGHGR